MYVLIHINSGFLTVLSAPLIQSQISPASKAAYREYLTQLEQMYSKLLVRGEDNCSTLPWKEWKWE